MRDRGLSMIEVLVALMIFAVGICSAVSVGYVATHWGTKARAEMEASRLARALYDYARRADPSVGETLCSPDAAFEFESPVALVWEIDVAAGSAPGLRSLKVTISRDTNGNGAFDPYVVSPESGDETVAVFNAEIR